MAPPLSSSRPLPRQTLIIIIVCATVSTFVFFVLLYRLIRSCRSRRSAPPLPPIQPLAHQREHQLAQFEASLRAQSYHSSLLTAPPPPQFGSPSSRGSKTSLLGSLPSPHTSYVATGEGSEELTSLTPLEPATPLPIPHPSFTDSTLPLSSINLNDNSTQSSFAVPSASTSALPSPSKQSGTLAQPTRDDQFRPHHHRPLSVASSLSRRNSRRGLPHGPHSQVQIILPAPLAPGIPPSSARQSLYEHDSPGDRMSFVDRWVPAGRDSIFDAPATHESNTSLGAGSNFTPQRPPRRTSSNSKIKTGMMTGSQINHRQYPSMPSLPSRVGGEDAPPVPRVPSIYGKVEGGEKIEGGHRVLRKNRVEYLH